MPARPDCPTGHRGPYRYHPTVEEVTRRRVGDPNPRGRIERSLGPFMLRDDLAAPGDLAFAEALALISADWDRQVANGTISAGIIGAYVKNLGTLHQQMTMSGLTRVCDLTPNFILRWCLLPQASGSPASQNTSRLRRSAARSFFDTAKALGLIDANPAKAVEFPQRDPRYVHPLTDDQIRHLQRYAPDSIDDTRTPAALALVMSGAANREASRVTVADVDLVDSRVWLHDGGYRQRDRWVPLDDWCRETLARRIRHMSETVEGVTGNSWVVYTAHRTRPTTDRQTEAITSLLQRLLKRTRIHEPGVNRIESIREWLAVKVFSETGSLEQVALRLGASSLDAVAHIVGYDWLRSPESVRTHTPPTHLQPLPGTAVEHRSHLD